MPDVAEDTERVAEATTMSTLQLGSDPMTAPDQTFASWPHALTLPGMRGQVVGRTVL